MSVLRMSREEMERGFAAGRQLTQEEWAHPQEIAWVDDLIREGKAKVLADWEWRDGFQCQRRLIVGCAEDDA